MLSVEIAEVSVTQMGFALMLKPDTRPKVVPIFIGPLETYSISSALEGHSLERPLTHDLLKTILKTMQYTLDKIIIDDFKAGTFFAKIYLKNRQDKTENSFIEIDARPSDAIALAIRFKSPMFMKDHVYDQTAIDMSLIQEKPDNPEQDFLSSLAESMPDELLTDEQKEELMQTILDEFSEADRFTSEKPRKKPKPKMNEAEQKLLTQKDVLNQRLKVAIQNENYEEAARLRDELQSLETRQAGQQQAQQTGNRSQNG